MNYRCRMGEIDIIARDKHTLVFVEVKFRRDSAQGNPVEAVNAVKQRKICQVATYYRMMHHIADNMSMRFDIIAILGDQLTHYENAFEYHY